MRINLSVVSGVVVAIFASIFGLSVNVSAQGGPDYLIGNLSLSENLTAAQIVDLGEKIGNYTKTLREKSNGNLTNMSIVLVDDLLKRNIINEKDKQDLVAFTSGLGQIKPTGNATLVSSNVSSLVDGLGTNSSNPILLTMKETLKKKPGPVPSIPGLPPLTIGDINIKIPERVVKIGMCAMGGSFYAGVLGAVGAAVACNAYIE